MAAVDYSFARYTVAQLQAAGITAVCRYLTGAGKAISASELSADLAGGIAVVLVFENSATDASGGFNVGVAYAQQANAALAALGLPLDTPVYFAADTDYPNPSDAVPYFQGIASVRPGLKNGCYGEAALIDLLFSEGLVGFGWESESTSFPGNGSLSPNAALWQKFTGAPLPSTDLDIIEKPDFGQLPRPAQPQGGEDEMFAANPSKDQFTATIRYLWYVLRTDQFGAGWQDLMWTLWTVPVGSTGPFGAAGFGQHWDLVVANIHDTAGSALRVEVPGPAGPPGPPGPTGPPGPESSADALIAAKIQAAGQALLG